MSYETRQIRFGYATQAAFNTPALDSAAVAEVTIEPLEFDPDVQIHELPQDHGSRNPVMQNSVHSVKGNAPKFSVQCPVDLSDIDHYLYTHFQYVTEGAGTPFIKEFKYFVEHPIFSNDEGHYLTWFRRFPIANVSQKTGGAIAHRIKLSGERDGFVAFESDWTGRNLFNTVEPTGVWTPRDGSQLLYFNDMTNATIEFGVDSPSPSPTPSPLTLTILSFEIESNYDAEKLGHDAANGFTDWGFKARAGNFQLKLLRDAATDEALSALLTGTMIRFTLTFGTKMTITMTGKIEKLEYEAEGLLVDSISGKLFAYHSTDAYGEPLIITVGNSIDRGW